VLAAAVARLDERGAVSTIRAALKQMCATVRGGAQGTMSIEAVHRTLLAYGEVYLLDDAVHDSIEWYEALAATAGDIGDRQLEARARP
jgi:hypothetical protein